MILGMDHLAITGLDLEISISALEEVGFEVQFIEADLANAEEKRPLLSKYLVTHSVALLRSKAGGMALELVCHGEVGRARAAYQPLIVGMRPELLTESPVAAHARDWRSVWRNALNVDATCGLWSAANAEVWGGAAGAELTIPAILLASPDLERERKFWHEGLGFIEQNRGRTEEGISWLRMSYAAPVPAWQCELILVESPGISTDCRLDDAGFSCLALTCSSLSSDLQRGLAHGGRDASGCFSALVNGRRLDLVLLRSPGGAPIELVQTARSVRS